MSAATAAGEEDRAAALRAHLVRLSALDGPLPIDRYMAEALTNPRYGYYAAARPLGARGDFTTAPEISQMFGELIGLWFATAWTAMGKPPAVDLVELGPGRGLLMADFLRATRTLPAFAEALQLHLVEVNPHLRAEQARRLADAAPRPLDRLADLDPSDRPLFLIANEFFDALPTKQFEWRAGRWRERRVDWREDGAHGLLAADGAPPDWIPDDAARDPGEGAVFELSPASLSLAHDIGARLAVQGGVALIVDYGYAPGAGFLRPRHGTLAAIRGHEGADPFGAPGAMDLSCHVDFGALARSAREAGARSHGPLTQRDFLKRCGIDARADRLGVSASVDMKAAEIATGHARLTDRAGMGALFKVLALTGGAGVAPVFA